MSDSKTRLSKRRFSLFGGTSEDVAGFIVYFNPTNVYYDSDGMENLD
jgi:hypothetical protein